MYHLVIISYLVSSSLYPMNYSE
ncbi:hypothetical protein F383_33199 [Gossypium arboreum]|uniref:Uncharacterized protein n=1 Tax=Gossypium arboreum TaxID=29729 RepID=A0A0B0N1W0_GOSAR|nr:hypothetical protein F383_33199 [Gossypium arboreum]